MHKNKVKNNNTTNSIVKNTLYGVISGAIVFLIAVIGFSVVVLKTNIENKFLFIFIIITSSLSSVIGSLTSAISAKRTRLLNGLLTTLILIIAEFLLLLLFNNSSLSLKIYFIIPSGIITGFLGSALGSNVKLKR